MLCGIVKTMFFLSTVTGDFPELPCSHTRAVYIYTEAVASDCTLWGVVPTATDLTERYAM